MLGQTAGEKEKMLYANVLKATASALDSQTAYFTPDEAQSLANELASMMPEGRQPVISRAGSVIGTYAGPGALGISLLRSASK